MIFTRRQTTAVRMEDFEYSAYHSSLESSDATELPSLYEAGFKNLMQLQIKMKRNATEIQEAMKIQDIKERDAKSWPLLKQSANLLKEFNETQADVERKLKAHAEAKSGFDKTVGENAVAAAKAHYDLLPTMFKAKMGAVDRILSGSSKDVPLEEKSDILKNVVELETLYQSGIDACNKAMEHYENVNSKPPGFEDIPNHLKGLRDQKKKMHLRSLLLNAHIESEAIMKEYSEDMLEKELGDVVAKLARAVDKDTKEDNALGKELEALRMKKLRVSISGNVAKMEFHVKMIQDAINSYGPVAGVNRRKRSIADISYLSGIMEQLNRIMDNMHIAGYLYDLYLLEYGYVQLARSDFSRAEAEMKEKAPDHIDNDPSPMLRVIENGNENLKSARTEYNKINHGELKHATFKNLSDKYVKQKGNVATELKDLDTVATKLSAMHKVHADIHRLAKKTKAKLEEIEAFERQIMETDHEKGTDLHDLLAKYEEPAKKHLEGVTQNGKSLRDAIEDVVNPFEKEFGDDQTIKDAVKRLEGEQTRLKTNATATKKALENHQGMVRLAKLHAELKVHLNKFEDLYEKLLKMEVEGKFPEVPAEKLKELLDAYDVLKKAIGDSGIVDTHTTLMKAHQELLKHKEHTSLNNVLNEIDPKIKHLAKEVPRNEKALPDVKKLQEFIKSVRDLQHSVGEFGKQAATMEKEFEKLETHLDDETKGALKEEQLALLDDLVERVGNVEREAEKKKKNLDELNLPPLAADNKIDDNLVAQHTAAQALLQTIKTEIGGTTKRLDGLIKLHKAQHKMIRMFNFYRDGMAKLASVIDEHKKKADEVLRVHHDWNYAETHNRMIPDLRDKLEETLKQIQEIKTKIEGYAVPEQSHDLNKAKIHVEKKTKLIEQLVEYAQSIEDKVGKLKKHLEAANNEDQIRAKLKTVSVNMEDVARRQTELLKRTNEKIKNGYKPGEVHEEAYNHNNEHAEEIKKMGNEIDGIFKQFGTLSKESKLHKQYEILTIKARFDRVLSQHNLNVATIEELRSIIKAEEATKKLENELKNLEEELGTKEGSLGKAIHTLQKVTIPDIENRFAGVGIEPKDTDDLPHPDKYIASERIAKVCAPVDEEYKRVMTELEKHISTTGEELGTTPYHNVRMAQNLNKVTKDLHEKVNPVKSRILEKLNKLRDSLITVKGCFDKSRSTGYVNAKNIEAIKKLREIVQKRKNEWMPDKPKEIRGEYIGKDDDSELLLKVYNCKKDFFTTQEWYTNYVQRYEAELGRYEETVEKIEEEGSGGSFLARLQKEKKEEIDEIRTLKKEYEELKAHIVSFEEKMDMNMKAIEGYLEKTENYDEDEWAEKWYEKRKQELFEQSPSTNSTDHYEAVKTFIKEIEAEIRKMYKAIEHLGGKNKNPDISELLHYKHPIGNQCKELREKKAARRSIIYNGAHDLRGILLPKAIYDLLIPAAQSYLNDQGGKLNGYFLEISKFKTNIEETHGKGEHGVFTQISEAFKRLVKETEAARKQAMNGENIPRVSNNDIILNKDELRAHKKSLKKMDGELNEIYIKAEEVKNEASSLYDRHKSSEHGESPLTIDWENVKEKYEQTKVAVIDVRMAIISYLDPQMLFWKLNHDLEPVIIKIRAVSRGIKKDVKMMSRDGMIENTDSLFKQKLLQTKISQ